MLAKLNYQKVVIESQDPGHRKSRQNKKKGGRYRIQRNMQNGLTAILTAKNITRKCTYITQLLILLNLTSVFKIFSINLIRIEMVDSNQFLESTFRNPLYG